MGKPAFNKGVVQVRIDKQLVKIMDDIIEALNKQIHPEQGEKKVTRSKFISDCIVLMLNVAPKFKVEKQKGGKKDA